MRKMIFALTAAMAVGVCMEASAAEPARVTVTSATITPLGYNGLLQLIDHSFGTIEGVSDGGKTTYTVPLDAPQYYLLGRNLLCLSPGDELTITLDEQYPERSVIDGRGATVVVNRFLKERSYVKGGSYLDAGRNARPTLEATLPLLDSIAKRRRAALDFMLSTPAELEVPAELRRREQARIDGDYLNSLLYYPSYNPGALGKDFQSLSREEFKAREAEYFARIATIAKPLLARISGDDTLLDIESVRFVLHQYSVRSGYGITLSPWFRSVLEVGEHIGRIGGNMTEQQFAAAEEFGSGIENEQLRAIYQTRLAASRDFTRGNAVTDIAITTLDGVTQKLSDLKGTPLYIDLWATWCGPCLAQAPHFKALSERYPGIKFVSISTDDKRETWQKFETGKEHGRIVELWSGREVRQKWGVEMIPRFVLIDANFEIVTIDAPRPSQTDRITPMLDKLLNGE